MALSATVGLKMKITGAYAAKLFAWVSAFLR